MLARTMAAVVGGYAVTVALCVFLSGMFPMPRSDSVLTAVLSSFAFYAAAIVWMFSARTARQAWAGLMVTLGILVCLASAAASGS